MELFKSSCVGDTPKIFLEGRYLWKVRLVGISGRCRSRRAWGTADKNKNCQSHQGVHSTATVVPTLTFTPDSNPTGDSDKFGMPPAQQAKSLPHDPVKHLYLPKHICRWYFPENRNVNMTARKCPRRHRIRAWIVRRYHDIKDCSNMVMSWYLLTLHALGTDFKIFCAIVTTNKTIRPSICRCHKATQIIFPLS